MPTVKLSPLFNDQAITSTGAPASGYKVYTYAAGSSTPLATYTDSTGTVAQANPIVLNANGRAANPIWLQSGLSYKFVLEDASGVQVGSPWDNVSGINDTGNSASQWTSSGATPTYVSATSFTLVGDQTTEFHIGRRLQFTVTAGTVYGTILTSAYTTLTTVTMTMDGSSALDSGLSAANLSILRADQSAMPSRLINGVTTVTIASAATVNIGAAASSNISISGTTTITAFDSVSAGVIREVTFSGALTLTHNATSLILPGSANITTAAGDAATFLSLGSGNWRCIKYQAAGGLPVGIGQTLTNVLGSRSSGVNYTNSTGKPIVVMASFSSNSATAYRWLINGNQVHSFSSSANQVAPGLLVVPPGATYQITIDAGTITIYSWWEIR